MFSSQLGRAVASRTGSHAATASAASPSILASAAAHRSTTACPGVLSRQRRLSSSKASCPPNGDSNRAAAQTPKSAALSPAKPAQKSTGNANGTRGKSAKAKTAKDKAVGFEKLPSVPSTEHLSPADVTLSRFYGLHRPISVTDFTPQSTKLESFNSIFDPKPKSKSPQDVIYTLSSAISAFDKTNQQDDNLRWEIIQESASNSTTAGTSSSLPRAKSLEELVAQFSPFTAPPPPAPANLATPVPRTAATATQTKPTQKTFKATLIVTENTNSDGQKTYTAKSSPMTPIADPSTRTPFKDRMRQRRMISERKEKMGEAEDAGDMHAISVKRQRKLKMKKHKYKKLMKRTRNLRRRLDRN